MKTLSSIGKRLKAQLDFDLTQQGKQLINLSTKRFGKDTSKFLNKNFVPTQKTTN